MKAMVLNQLVQMQDNQTPLTLTDLPVPAPGPDELLLQVSTCGVCHTELDEIEGRTPPSHLPMVLGHQVVGHITAVGTAVTQYQIGDRVGVAWIFSACGECEFCRSDQENLCSDFQATGRDAPGGYAEYMTVPAAFAYAIPPLFTDVEAAPLLCAGAIGYRSLHLTGLQDGQRLGLVGFGGSNHLVLKMARFLFPHSDVYVFARDAGERTFALGLGAAWAGDTAADPPHLLDAIIDTTPVWRPILEALRHLQPGGRLVVNAIRKEQGDQEALLQLDYPIHLWLEKEIKSVANVTRHDVQAFLELAASIPIRPEVQEFSLADANQALMALRTRQIRGSKVLRVRPS